MYNAVLDFAARQRRIYRAQSAAFLANLAPTAGHPDLASINWSALESVPHWCFLCADEQHTLRLLCGAVFLAPQMHGWIDGKLIQSVRTLIGPEAYDLVLRHTDALEQNLDIDQVNGDMAKVLHDAGSTVLLGAIPHPLIQSLVAHHVVGQAVSAPTLVATVATPLYQRALQIFLQLRQQSQATESVPELSNNAGAGA